MNGLNEWAPTIVAAGFLAYLCHTYFRIKREQERDRERDGAAE